MSPAWRSSITSIRPAATASASCARSSCSATARRCPDEETQYRAYRRFLEWAGGRPVTIRTLDIGGDKPIRGLTPEGEANPFLGLRGVRLTLARPEVFRTQLRALARAAVHGDLKVMIPMVTRAGGTGADAPHCSTPCMAELQARRHRLPQAAARHHGRGAGGRRGAGPVSRCGLLLHRLQRPHAVRDGRLAR